MTLAKLKILSISIWVPTIPITYCATQMTFKNHCSWSIHLVNELKGSVGTTILLKNDNLALVSLFATFSIEAKDPNTFILTTVDAIDVKVVEFVIKA
jgi:hypothetical protein